MKANRAFQQEEAVSNVLGGVLMVGLIFLFLVVLRIDFVPNWEEDKEASRFTTLQGQLAGLRSETDRQATNSSVSEVGQALGLGDRKSSPLLVAPPRPGALSFTPNAAEASVSASEFTVFARDGFFAGATDEIWTDASSATVDDVGQVHHLRIRLIDPGSESGGDNVTLMVYDADDEYAGEISVGIVSNPPDSIIATTVKAADGTTLYGQGVSFHQVTDVDFWWTDTLADEFHFADVLRAADGPLRLEFEENGMEGEFTISYTQQTAGGGVFVGGSGTTHEDFLRTYPGGRLNVDTSVSYFPDYQFQVENGAVILQQGTAAILRIEPSFDVVKLGSVTRVSMTVPSLFGQADAVSLPGTATVYLDGQETRNLLGSAPMWTYTVTSQHPGAWANFFREVAKDGGLEAGAGEYEVSQTATTATITVYGQTSDPSSTDHDLSIDLTRSRVQVRIET